LSAPVGAGRYYANAAEEVLQPDSNVGAAQSPTREPDARRGYAVAIAPAVPATGTEIRRQHSIGPYIVDVYCPSERLVLELDGSAHDSNQAAARDLDRERFLVSAGLTVLRLENRDVFENPEGVLKLIRQQFRSG
jgi:hypothetical protein